MSIGLDHLDVSRLARAGSGFSLVGRRGSLPRRLGVVLPVILMVGAAGLWLVLPAFDSDSDGADGDPPPLTTAALVQPSAAPDDTDTGIPPPEVAPISQAPAPIVVELSPASRLRLSRQSWRRGGLGSNAQVTFTLRNDNAFAVKDIEIACAFARGDGSHLTDRKRTIPVTMDPKARKRFDRMHIGFVNVHANRANCAVVAANRA